MSVHTAVATLSTSASGICACWERLWRSSGIQFVIIFTIVYAIYPNRPMLGASPDELGVFYSGTYMRIVIAAMVSNLGLLPGLAAEFLYPTATRTSATT